MALLLLLFSVFIISYIFALQSWQKLDTNALENMDQTLLVYDKDNNLCAGVHGLINRIDVSLEDVPLYVQKAFIAIEDARFYEHGGIDIVRILGAFLEDIKSGSLKQGASTISQQLIKLTHLSSEKSFDRKIKEAILAIKLESVYTKDEILEMYLNCVYFGNGAYGIEAASQAYFGKSASKLTLDEGALLAGILKSPTNYAPHINPENSIKRRNIVLTEMQKYGFISESEATDAKALPLTLNESDDSLPSEGYYINYAVSQASDILGMDKDELMLSGYEIYTSMDSTMQNLASESMNNDELFRSDAEDGTMVQGAIVILDSKTGNIAAMVGGRNGESSGLNRAIDMQRQPGSAIKPILVYAPAIQSGGYTPSTLIDDVETEFGNYSPKNYSDKYNGVVTMRQAIAKSLNVPAVSVLDDIGVDTGKNFASNVGITFSDQDTGLSLALGGFYNGVSPFELCAAYQPLANNGNYSTPSCITMIKDENGQIIYSNQSSSSQVMDSDNSFLLTDMLHSTVEWGTATLLQIDSVPLASKTGTSDYNNGEGNTDAWCVAYNPDYIACAWTGFDITDETHHLTNDATGGSVAAKLLKPIFENAYSSGGPWYDVPSNVVEVELDTKTNTLATPFSADETYTEYFVKGTQPSAEPNTYDFFVDNFGLSSDDTTPSATPQTDPYPYPTQTPSAFEFFSQSPMDSPKYSVDPTPSPTPLEKAE